MVENGEARLSYSALAADLFWLSKITNKQAVSSHPVTRHSQKHLYWKSNLKSPFSCTENIFSNEYKQGKAPRKQTSISFFSSWIMLFLWLKCVCTNRCKDHALFITYWVWLLKLVLDCKVMVEYRLSRANTSSLLVEFCSLPFDLIFFFHLFPLVCKHACTKKAFKYQLSAAKKPPQSHTET